MSNILRTAYYFLLKERNPLKYAKSIGVNIGEHVLIGKGCQWGSEPYLITIGAHCQLANFVSICTHGGGNVVRMDNPSFDVFGKVVIKDWAYVGSRSMIMPGVTIGKGAMVAAGAVVTHSVPDGMVVGGNPARIICSVEDYYKKNKAFDLASKGMSSDKKREMLLSLPDDKFIRK